MADQAISAMSEGSALSGTESIPMVQTVGQNNVCTPNDIAAFVGGANRWKVLFAWGVPVILPPNGTVGANGALTLGTALPATFPNCWMFFPANAINTGSAAGFYFVQMSSGTLGTIFNNVLSGEPTVITSPTAFSGTTGAGYTTPTSAQAMVTLNMPTNPMGTGGKLRFKSKYARANTVNAASVTWAYGGTQIANYNVASVSVAEMGRTLENSGSTSLQFSYPTAVGNVPLDEANNNSTAPAWTTIATGSAGNTVVISGTLATPATEYLILGGVVLEALFA